jgi:hypothetical protein
MLRRLGLALGLAVFMCGGTARADGESTDEVLKRVFPDRDLSNAAIKIVNHQHRYYIVADTAEILANGTVRVTNGVVTRHVSEPNEPLRGSSVEGTQLILKFEKPVKQLADLKNNALVSAK